MPARHRAQHPTARQVGGGVRGHPQLGPDQHPAGEGPVQLGGDAVDGVSFWHPSIIGHRRADMKINNAGMFACR
ncbi:hypothetical protein [Kitasatospora albolonga]|uniref:hypothetical protein n=1 Tax=Kitasatospora albolonga TaxID=68173 RepID=UPI003CD068B8